MGIRLNKLFLSLLPLFSPVPADDDLSLGVVTLGTVVMVLKMLHSSDGLGVYNMSLDKATVVSLAIWVALLTL